VFDSEASVALLIVGLTPTLARALTRGERTTDTARLRDIIEQAGTDLVPQTTRSLDPEDTDRRESDRGDADVEPEPTVWFSIETGDDTQPDDLDAQLLRVPGVTAAYVTPAQGPP
jgi:hypothetical protein